MTSKEINRTTINAFLVRAIGHAAAVAIDAEFGLRMRHVEITDVGNVRIDFDNGLTVNIGFEHFVPHSEIWVAGHRMR